MSDLFVSLSHNKFVEATYEAQQKLEELIACRHDYPMWPAHGDNPFDIYEEEFHGAVRHQYYRATLTLLAVVRMLRDLS